MCKVTFTKSFQGIKLVNVISSAGLKIGSQSSKVSGVVDIFELPGDFKFNLKASKASFRQVIGNRKRKVPKRLKNYGSF